MGWLWNDCQQKYMTYCGVNIPSGAGEYNFKTKDGYFYTVNDERVSTMTREDAKNKLRKVTKNNHQSGYVVNPVAIDDWLDSLEALGLIKFDKPESEVVCASYDGEVVKVIKISSDVGPYFRYELWINNKMECSCLLTK